MRSVVPSGGNLLDLPPQPAEEVLDEPVLLEQEEVIRPALETFFARFPAVRQETFGRHPEFWPLMDRIKAALAALPPLRAHPQVKVSWSLGQGNWATVPWIALMDEAETTSTQRGIYGVFLFPHDLSGVYLTLNQGVTEIVQHGRGKGRRELMARAERARQLVPEIAEAGFRLDHVIDLRATAQLGTDYEHSTIAHKFYPAGAVPSDSEIASDLTALLEAYGKVLAAGLTGRVIEAPPVDERPPGVWVWSPGDRAAHWDELYEGDLMAIGWDELGDLSRFHRTQDVAAALLEIEPQDNPPVNDALACHEFVHVLRPGDLVFAKRGLRTIIGHGVVTGDYRHDTSRKALRNTRTVRWLARGEWPVPGLPVKALTNWSSYPDAIAALKDAVGRSDEETKAPVAIEERKPFDVQQAMQGLFMPQATFERALGVWRHKRNLILQGAPGVGKSYVARRMAYALMGYEDPSRVRTVQFHQAYAYEDFVQGFRPNGTGFELREGVFLEFCRRALKDPDETYVFIIDEINRGNLSKILGELMLLIEGDKRESKWGVKLAYAEMADARFYVPPNVFLLGMMNTADRSLAVVDYALRRRFAFVTVEPGFGEASFEAHLAELAVSSATIARIRDRMGALNTAIAEDRANLGPGFCIGHSFFSGPPRAGQDGEPAAESEADWYRRVIETEVAPLLEEYWFDDPGKAGDWSRKLLA
nr:DUF3578 domain-containing protein [Pseudoroseomonas vastitatis]